MGLPQFYSEDDYSRMVKKGHLGPHIIFPLSQLIKKEFPKANFKLPMEITEWKTEEQKILMMFLLSTSSYEYMKVYLSETDIRLVESSEAIIKNEELKQSICTWKFHKIEVILEDEALTIIEGSL